MIRTDLFAALGPRISCPRAAGESRTAFADMLPLAAIRKQSEPGGANSPEVSPDDEVGCKRAAVDAARSLKGPLRPKTEKAVLESASDVGADGKEADVLAPEETPKLPATASDGPASRAVSQSVSNKEDKGPVTDACSAGMPVPDARKSADTLGRPMLPGNNEGSGNSPGGAGAAVAMIANSGLNKIAADGGAAIPGNQAPQLGSPGTDAGGAKMGMSTPLATQSSEAVRTLSERQTAGENTSGSLSDRESLTSSRETGPLPASQGQAITMEGLAKAGSLLDTREETRVQSEPVVPAQVSALPVSETLSTSARPDSTCLNETVLVKDPVGSLGTQILDYVQASLVRGDRQLLIRLDPPELGSITVRFQEQRGLVEGILEVSRDQTRWDVEQALPQALRSLQEAGIQIRRLDVVVSHQSEKELEREHWPQDGGTKQQGSERDEGWSQGSSAAPRATWTTTVDSSLVWSKGVTSQVDAATGRINMLI